MAFTLQIVGICYYCGYDGIPYPHYCRKEKGNPCWEAYKQGKADRKKGTCAMSDEDIAIERERFGYKLKNNKIK